MFSDRADEADDGGDAGGAENKHGAALGCVANNW